MTNAVETLETRSARPERRSGARHCALMRTAKLLSLSGEYLCIVHDVSASGTKLRLFHEFPADTHMFLELSNGAQYAVERRWADGGYAGFQFAAEVDVDEFIREPNPHGRRPIRLRFNRPATVRAGGDAGHAMLVDLSHEGACIETGRQFAVGQLVRLDIEGIPSRLGHVCWRRDFAHGVVFQDAFTLRDLALHAHAAQPYLPEAPHVARPDAAGKQALCA
ncbi:MAG: PilZ domain-containing protein [Novosphingobium sp.]|nr:PilZ domain-containing protein [Novosphingobium sp.]